MNLNQDLVGRLDLVILSTGNISKQTEEAQKSMLFFVICPFVFCSYVMTPLILCLAPSAGFLCWCLSNMGEHQQGLR